MEPLEKYSPSNIGRKTKPPTECYGSHRRYRSAGSLRRSFTGAYMRRVSGQSYLEDCPCPDCHAKRHEALMADIRRNEPYLRERG